jgi:hypothetical protein
MEMQIDSEIAVHNLNSVQHVGCASFMLAHQIRILPIKIYYIVNVYADALANDLC